MYVNLQHIGNIRSSEEEKITVVGYCRLSRDEDKENYASIEEQKRIIKDYAISRNWTIEDKDFYIDDNVSGYTFTRPEFSKMMNKVKEGNIKVFKDDIPMLYVIEELKPVIELIFKLYVENGYGFQKISQVLNEQYSYPTPSEYYRQKHLERGRVYKHKVQENWTKDMVSNILKNEIYTGTLVTHKKRTVNIRGKTVKLPKEEHFIFENHHEAIISKEMFEQAKEIQNAKSKKHTSGATTKRDYFFSGMCECSDCGSGMSGIMIKRKVNEKGYDCSKYRQFSTKACHCHEIKEKDILIHLKEFLKFTKKQYLEKIKNIKLEVKKDKKSNKKFQLKNKLEILNTEYKMLVMQKIKELSITQNEFERNVIENTYKELAQEKMNAISHLQNLLEDDEKKILEQKADKLKTSVEYFDEIINSEVPNRMILQIIIDRIYIDRDKTIQFDLKPDIKKLI